MPDVGKNAKLNERLNELETERAKGNGESKNGQPPADSAARKKITDIITEGGLAGYLTDGKPKGRRL